MSDEKCPKGGTHEWVDSPLVLLSNPPQYQAICRKCGKEKTWSGEYYDANEYYRIKEKFGK